MKILVKLKNVYSDKFIILLLVLLICCVTPFNPNISKYDDILVVDGAVSNLPGSAYVKLSVTSPYNRRQEIPVKDAQVMLIDDLGNDIEFVYITKGEFRPRDPTFTGEIGREYRIHIERADGTIYESIAETLKEPVPFDSIKYVFVEGLSDSDRGFEIQLDIHNIKGNEVFLYWEYEETWEFMVPFVSPEVPNSTICWRTEKRPVFLINSTQNLVENRFMDYPLFFIDNQSNRLHIKYSVLITQHALSEKTYNYYRDLKDINEETGSLFDNIPTILVGNIRNLSSPDESVLGIFQVSGSIQKRMFIENKDIFEKIKTPEGFEHCQRIDAGLNSQAGFIDSLMKAGWTIFDSKYNAFFNDNVVSLSNFKSCYDCKLWGTNIKPEYWDEEE